ncbi:MAG: hypothetical protein JO040_05405, partial [Gemmatimonadetes bacterium]|nr:hypothetical protein [Gemmatimonadota bacterium]
VLRHVTEGPATVRELAAAMGAGAAPDPALLERTARRVRSLFRRGYLDALPAPAAEGVAERISACLTGEAPPVSLFEQGTARVLRAVEAAREAEGGDPFLAAYRRDAAAAGLAAGVRMACVEGSFRGWLEEYWRWETEGERSRLLAELAGVLARVFAYPGLLRAGCLAPPSAPGGPPP